MVDAVRRYATDVRLRQFPEAQHGYRMEDAEVEKLRAALKVF